MSSCFFLGHRDSPESLWKAIYDAAVRHITEYGVTEFIVGHYGRFDNMAARAVIAAKQRFPHITLTLLLPYHPSERPVPLAEGFDCSLYPPDIEKTPRRAAIVCANRYAIAHCEYLIAYSRYAAGNTEKLIRFAYTRAAKGTLRITNLAEFPE